MWNLIFGRTFWGMMVRFCALSIALNLITLPAWMADPELAALSWLQWAGLWSGQTLMFSWMGWGLAHWRFSPAERPVLAFAPYPLISGLGVLPCFWILVSLLPEPEAFTYRAATLFGVIAGPVMGLAVAAFFRLAPQFTALRK